MYTTPPHNPSVTHRNLIVLRRNAFVVSHNAIADDRNPFVISHNAFVLAHNAIASPVIACALCCIAAEGRGKVFLPSQL